MVQFISHNPQEFLIKWRIPTATFARNTNSEISIVEGFMKINFPMWHIIIHHQLFPECHWLNLYVAPCQLGERKSAKRRMKLRSLQSACYFNSCSILCNFIPCVKFILMFILGGGVAVLTIDDLHTTTRWRWFDVFIWKLCNQIINIFSLVCSMCFGF